MGESEISIQSCVGGIKIQDGYRRHSPAYFPQSSKIKNSASIRIDHSLNLEREEDCSGMTFLRGSRVSRKGEQQSSYEFSPYTGASGSFIVGRSYGEITTIREDMVPLCIASKERGRGEELSYPRKLQLA